MNRPLSPSKEDVVSEKFDLAAAAEGLQFAADLSQGQVEQQAREMLSRAAAGHKEEYVMHPQVATAVQRAMAQMETSQHADIDPIGGSACKITLAGDKRFAAGWDAIFGKKSEE